MPNDSTSTNGFFNYLTITSTTISSGENACRRPIVHDYLGEYPPAPKKKPTAIPTAMAAEGAPLGSEVLVYYKRSRVPGDYDEAHRDQGETLYQNVQDLLARFFITVHYNSGPVPNWREWCIGATSMIYRDNLGRLLHEVMHMPMFDYDGKNIKAILRKDVQYLQKKWGLGPATIFQTKKGFHVYFMTDAVSWASYHTMLCEVKCCEGFKIFAPKSGYGALRVSAKYSTFDIKLDSVMQPEKAKALPARKIRKARVIEAILSLGEKCGTHIALLYPEWAYYCEDETPWKQPARAKKPPSKKSKSPYDLLEVPMKPPTKVMIGDRPKQKLILKPRKLTEQALEPKISEIVPGGGLHTSLIESEFQKEFVARYTSENPNPCKEVSIPVPILVDPSDKTIEDHVYINKRIVPSVGLREIFSLLDAQEKKA